MQLGILGGGQLGRMIALAASPLGVKCVVLDPEEETSAGLIFEQVRGAYDSESALDRVARDAIAVTYEFENVPVESARYLAEKVPVFPPPKALEVSQDRLIEKNFFRELGVPTPPFAGVQTREDLDAAVAEIGLPAVLKTRRFGYDGKGQFVLRTQADLEAAWQTLAGRPLILEGFVPFDREVSLISVRGRNGETAYYPLVENVHREGILYRSLAPAPDCAEELFERAAEYASQIMEVLDYVGVLAIEWFQVGGQLLVNEMAPRVHNSGHWTIEGAVTSQFENHVRAGVGFPLGSTAAVGHSAMFNLIGSHPPFHEILAMPNAHLHWYGKTPRPSRKIGHVTLTANTAEERDELVREWQRRFEK